MSVHTIESVRVAMTTASSSLGVDWNESLEAGAIFGDHNPGPDGLDSLASVSLAVELEDIFKVQFEPMAFVGINSPSGLEELVLKLLSST